MELFWRAARIGGRFRQDDMTRITFAATATLALLSGPAAASSADPSDPTTTFREGTSSMYADAIMAGRDPERLRSFLSRYPSSPIAESVTRALEEVGGTPSRTKRAPARSLRELGVAEDPI